MKIVANESANEKLPDWFRGQVDMPLWFFTGGDGDKWVATVKDGNVIFSGSDVNWNEIRLAKKEAEEALESFGRWFVAKIYDTNAASKEVAATGESNSNKILQQSLFFLGGWSLNGEGEPLWVGSVLVAALSLLR